MLLGMDLKSFWSWELHTFINNKETLKEDLENAKLSILTNIHKSLKKRLKYLEIQK